MTQPYGTLAVVIHHPERPFAVGVYDTKAEAEDAYSFYLINEHPKLYKRIINAVYETYKIKITDLASLKRLIISPHETEPYFDAEIANLDISTLLADNDILAFTIDFVRPRTLYDFTMFTGWDEHNLHDLLEAVLYNQTGDLPITED